jgi:hypothetical protein
MTKNSAAKPKPRGRPKKVATPVKPIRTTDPSACTERVHLMATPELLEAIDDFRATQRQKGGKVASRSEVFRMGAWMLIDSHTGAK